MIMINWQIITFELSYSWRLVDLISMKYLKRQLLPRSIIHVKQKFLIGCAKRPCHIIIHCYITNNYITNCYHFMFSNIKLLDGFYYMFTAY